MLEGLIQVDTEVSKAFLSRLTVHYLLHNLRIFVMNYHDRDSQHEEKGCVSGAVDSVLLYLLNIARLDVQHRFFDDGKTLFLSFSPFSSVHTQIPHT